MMNYLQMAAFAWVSIGVILAIFQLIRKPLKTRMQQTVDMNDPSVHYFASMPMWIQHSVLFLTIVALWPLEIYLAFKGEN